MYDFKQVEEEVLNFWNEKNIHQKANKKNAKGKKFYFLQGPPYTSGRIHIGHAWNNSLKDLALRYKRMQGFNVWDRGGYDMHGLPTENAVQKKLGFKTKEEIEKYGMDKFVKECYSFSKEMALHMNNDFERLGIWFDHENAYKPIEKSFMSGEWTFFKKAYEQGRLYKGVKVMHWDGESETSLAKHELEYKNITDTSIFLKFKKLNSKNEYFIIWTTTPWTIPFNLAIMVNPDLEYVKLKVKEGEEKGEEWFLAKDLAGIFMTSVVRKKFEILQTLNGDELEGMEYEHFLNKDMNGIYNSLKKDNPKIHSIILSKEYVDTSAGSGLVHCAPGCGPEDQEASRPYGIEAFNTLNERGQFESEGTYKGWTAKVDDNKFIEEFKKKRVLIASTKVEHEYPHSWRSHKPVVFRTTSQWFLKTQDMTKDLLKNNKDVHWVPKTAGESYTRWTENLRDNSVTRQRYWGTPVPIYVNVEDENDYFVIGSAQEWEKLTGKKLDDMNMHRPWIDEHEIKKKGKTYRRIADVADVWIDSGTASWNCLYNDPKLIKKWFPADLVLEATEQTRLWFSLLQICSNVMFAKSCYENVFVHGMILDFQGTKMSKSLGNIISPYEVLDKYGADVLRYYMCQVSAGENINFSWEDVKIKQRNLNILSNIASYIEDLSKRTKPNSKLGKDDIEEKYILSRKNSAIQKITKLMEEYRIDEIIKEIEELYLDLSRIYIKLTRDKSNDEEKNGIVLYVVEDVFLDVVKMFSIVCPFITDKLYKDVFSNKSKIESIHLSSWPKSDKKKINSKLEEEMKNILDIVEKGFAKRDKIKVGLKWPLKSVTINSQKEINKDYFDLIKNQLNVKDIKLNVNEKTEFLSIEYDQTSSFDLEAEGYGRELSRQIQAFRKKLGLNKTDIVDIYVEITDDKLRKYIESQRNAVAQRTNSKKFEIVTTLKETFKNKTSFEIKGSKGIVAISMK